MKTYLKLIDNTYEILCNIAKTVLEIYDLEHLFEKIIKL